MATLEDFGIILDREPNSQGEVALFCPRCKDNRKRENIHKRPLSLNVEKGTWNCKNCGWADGLRLGMVNDRPREYRKPEELPHVDIHIQAAEFLIGRKIDLAVARRYGVLGSATEIKYPYRRNGELVNVKTRKFPEKGFYQEEGCELIFWGLDLCEGATQVVICEGEMDALACATAGLPYVLSVPNGAKGSNEYVESGTALFAGCDSIIIAGDNDDDGRAMVSALAERIGPAKCYRVSWPDDCKDANEVLLTRGPDILRTCIADAVPFPLPGIIEIETIWSSFEDLYQNGLPKGISTGWESVDEIYTIADNEVTTITGIPNSGKSTWLDNLIINLGKLHDWRFGIYSPENYPSQRHLARFAQKYLQKPFSPGPTERMDYWDLQQFRIWAQGRLNFIEPDIPSLEEILERARQLIIRYGINGLVIDPWNWLEHSRPQWMTETEYVGHALTQVVDFAHKYRVHVWIVAHPKKMYREEGVIPVPTAYDISGSAHWANKSDNIITVFRPFDDQNAPTQIHTKKIRLQPENGKSPRQVDLRFDAITGCYKPVHITHKHFGVVS